MPSICCRCLVLCHSLFCLLCKGMDLKNIQPKAKSCEDSPLLVDHPLPRPWRAIIRRNRQLLKKEELWPGDDLNGLRYGISLRHAARAQGVHAGDAQTWYWE